MKTKPLFIALAALMIACSGNEKQAQLDELRKQRDNISEKITKLETEIANGDSNKVDLNAKLVAVEQIKRQSFNHYVEVQGMLDGDENVAVYAEAMGVVEEIYVKVGQYVTKGQTLARLNDAALQEQIKGAKSSLDLATEMYEKQKRLWDQNIGSEVQYLQAKNAKESAEAGLAGLNRQMDMMRIKSPINGTVEDAPLKIGQTASPQLPAFRVVNFSKLKVKAEVAEAYAAKITLGDNVLVYLPDIRKEYEASINFVSKYINEVNRTFQVEASLKESSPNMKANMVAVLKINDYKADSAVILPINLVQNDQTGSFVFVVEKAEKNQLIARKKVVKTGQIYNGMAEIIEGLTTGDKVITMGHMGLEDGESIRL